MDYVADFWKCIQYHSNHWFERASYEVLHFRDVERYVTAEIDQLAQLRDEIQHTQARNEDRLAEAKALLEAEKNRIAATRAHYAETSKPLLDEYDNISLAAHYYSEAVNTAAMQAHVVDYLQNKETTNYGYRSKHLISVSLMLEALRLQVSSGKPFAKELALVIEESESPDLAVLAAPMQRIAAGGLPTERELRNAGYQVALAVEDTTKWSNQAAASSSSWFDMFKFRTVATPQASQLSQMQKAAALDTAHLFTAHVDESNWVGALKLSDGNFQKMTSSSNVLTSKEVQQAVEAFRGLAEPVVATDAFFRYAEASLVTARLAFVEDLLQLKSEKQ